RLTPVEAASSVPQLLSYANLSRGTRRVLRILLSVVAGTATALLMEQPEDAIHPGLLIKLLDILKAYAENRNILIASHSPVVVNSLPAEAIQLVTLQSSGTKARRLTPNEIEAAARYMEREGSLSDFIASVQD